jgi:hypothetical protein
MHSNSRNVSILYSIQTDYGLHPAATLKMEAACSLKCWYPCAILHGVISQKTLLLILARLFHWLKFEHGKVAAKDI